MMEGWEYAAQNMLAHFRAAFGANIFLAMNWHDEQVRKTRKLDESAVKYLISTQEVLMRQGRKRIPRLMALFADPASTADDLRARRTKSPGDPLVWISELFIPPDIE